MINQRLSQMKEVNLRLIEMWRSLLKDIREANIEFIENLDVSICS